MKELKIEIELSLKELLTEIKDEGRRVYISTPIGEDYEQGYEAMKDKLNYYLDLISEGKLKVKK